MLEELPNFDNVEYTMLVKSRLGTNQARNVTPAK